MDHHKRHFTAQQKVQILREHFIDKVPVSQVCQKHQLQPTLFYHWQKTFFRTERRPLHASRPAPGRS